MVAPLDGSGRRRTRSPPPTTRGIRRGRPTGCSPGTSGTSRTCRGTRPASSSPTDRRDPAARRVVAGGDADGRRPAPLRPPGRRRARVRERRGRLVERVARARPRAGRRAERRPVLAEPHEHAEPAWGVGQRSFAWSPDGDALALDRNEDGFGRLVVVARDADGTRGARAVAKGWHHGLDWGPGGIVCVRSGARTPPAVTVLGSRTATPRSSGPGGSSAAVGVARQDPRPASTPMPLAEPEAVDLAGRGRRGRARSAVAPRRRRTGIRHGAAAARRRARRSDRAGDRVVEPAPPLLHVTGLGGARSRTRAGRAATAGPYLQALRADGASSTSTTWPPGSGPSATRAGAIPSASSCHRRQRGRDARRCSCASRHAALVRAAVVQYPVTDLVGPRRDHAPLRVALHRPARRRAPPRRSQLPRPFADDTRGAASGPRCSCSRATPTRWSRPRRSTGSSTRCAPRADGRVPPVRGRGPRLVAPRDGPRRARPHRGLPRRRVLAR